MNNKRNSYKHSKSKAFKVTIIKNGPYLVSGKLPLSKEIIGTDKEGHSVKWIKGYHYPNKKNYALCRCGQSKNKPYCDGTHIKVAFDGTETASRKKYIEQSEKIAGPDLDLTDAQEFCALARFCHNKAGDVWELTENSSNRKSKKIAIKQACDCPAGRLVVWNKKTGKPIEQKFKPSISLVEDPKAKASGPIWLKGNVSLESSDGTRYEIRNRVTLCRCGKSKNKPFCDGSHISVGFNDGNKTVNKYI